MTESVHRQRLRQTFEEVPDLYDRARAPYPEPLFDDLLELAGLREGRSVLEIGCATGRATLPLAERGLQVVCVELGPKLAALARRKLAAFPSVEVVNAAFESWRSEDRRFDAVTAFTAWHWVDPSVRYARAAELLHEGGALAVVATQHVLPEGGDPFFVEVQADYDAIVPSEENVPPPRPDEVGDLGAEIEASALFRLSAVRRHLWTTRYSADRYIEVLETYSGHRSLDPGTRRRLYERIRRRVEARPGSSVELALLATLNVARLL